jgi:hypothetical protein
MVILMGPTARRICVLAALSQRSPQLFLRPFASVSLLIMVAEATEDVDDADEPMAQAVDVPVSRFSSVLEMIPRVSTVSHESTIVLEGEKQAVSLPTNHPQAWN